MAAWVAILLQAAFSGYSTNGSTVTQLSGLQQAGAVVGLGGALAAGGLGIAQGISRGGAGGALSAVSSGLGVAALLDPEPISKAVLAGVAAVAGLFGSFMNGPQQRTNQINQELAQNQYLPPEALNVIQGMNGTYQDFDARGNLRTSTMSALPTVAEPYIWAQTHGVFGIGLPPTYYDVPGSVKSPYSGYASGTGQTPTANNGPQTVVIQAMDSQSFSDWVRGPANSNAIGESLADHLQSHEGRASAAIRNVAGG